MSSDCTVHGAGYAQFVTCIFPEVQVHETEINFHFVWVRNLAFCPVCVCVCGGGGILSLCADKIIREVFGPNRTGITRLENTEYSKNFSNSYAGHGIIILRG